MTDARSDAGSPVDGTSIAVVNWRDPWHPQAGGAERYAWEMACGLVRRGARVRYLTARARGQARRENRDGIEVIRMGGRFGVYPRVLAWLAPRRRRFDAVIDCQNGIPFFTPWVLSRRVPVLCVVHHVHDAQFGVHFPAPVAAIGRLLEGPVARWSYRRHECVAVSDSTAGAMRRRLGWTGLIHIVPNGLSPDCFEAPAPGNPPTAEGAAAGGPALSWVGRLVAHKRADRILDVADRLRPAGVTIQVIGRGPAAGPLVGQVASRGLDGVVRLRGYLPDEEKRAAVAASVLHLNTSQGEGWGLCVLAVRDGDRGWLVHDGERIEDVTERAVKELADPARRAAVAAACRAWAANFDWDQSAGQLARLVGAAVRRKARWQGHGRGAAAGGER